MHDLSPPHQSFGGKCGLMGTKSRQTRPTVTWLAKPIILARHWWKHSIQEHSLATFPNPYYEPLSLISLWGFKQYSSFFLFLLYIFLGDLIDLSSHKNANIFAIFLFFGINLEIFLNLNNWNIFKISLCRHFLVFIFILEIKCTKPASSGSHIGLYFRVRI